MAFGGSRDVWADLLESMKKCEELFDGVQKAIMTPDHFKYALALASQHLPGNSDGSSIPRVLKRRLELIKSRNIRIMVAGDVSAGKSTILNILMGDKYLPVQVLPTTKVFCELQACLERSATFQFEPTDYDLNADVTLTLPEDPNDRKWVYLRNSIKTKSYQGKQLRKILIKWPIDIYLKGSADDPDQTPPMEIVNGEDPHQTIPMKVVDVEDPHRTTPMEVVDGKDRHQTTVMELVAASVDSGLSDYLVEDIDDDGREIGIEGNGSEGGVASGNGHKVDGLSSITDGPIDNNVLNNSRSDTEPKACEIIDDNSERLMSTQRRSGTFDTIDSNDEAAISTKSRAFYSSTVCDTIDGNDDASMSARSRGETELVAGDEVRDDFNIIFVDTPGITSIGAVERDVFEEIDAAGSMYQGFVLVIKDTDIRIEGLQTLMDDIEDSIRERTDMINPECTLFVANKFDTIPDDEKVVVKQHIREKLLEKWPRISTSDVIFMSAKENEIYGDDLRHTPSENFLTILRKFVAKAIRISLEEHCLWLLNLLEITRAILKSGRQWVAIRHTKSQLETTLMDFRTEAITLAEELNMRPDSERDVEELYAITSDELKNHLADPLDWNEEEINREIPNADIDWTSMMDNVDSMICKKISETKALQIEALRAKHQRKWESIYSAQVNRIKRLQNCLEGMSCTDNEQSAMKDGIATALLPVALSGVIRVAPAAAPFLFLAVPLLPIPLLLKSFVDEYRDYKNEQLRDTFKRDKVVFFRTRTNDLSKVFQRSLQPSDANDLKKSPFFCRFIGDFPKVILLQQIDDILSTIQVLRDLGSSTKPGAATTECDKYLARTMETYSNGILVHDIHPDRLHWQRGAEGNRVRLGNNGQVFEAKMDLIGYDGTVDVAVKELQYEKSSDSQPDSSIHSDLDIYRECFLLRQLSRSPCENIVKYHGSSFKAEPGETRTICRLRLVFELCDGGTLDGVIKTQVQNEAERLTHFRWYFREIIKGLKFLHDKNIVHRDMKPANCLLMRSDDSLPRVKIADVGAAKQRDLICTEAQNRGTPAYWAPEIIERTAVKFHSKASDVYSLGLVLWELWFRTYAYQDFNIQLGKVPDKFPKRNSEVTKILRMCLRHRPDQRGTVDMLHRECEAS